MQIYFTNLKTTDFSDQSLSIEKGVEGEGEIRRMKCISLM